MIPVVALESLRKAVMVLSGAVLLLSLFLVLERGIVAFLRVRTERREALLTRLVYRSVQVEPGNSPGLGVLSRFDRRLVRGILLRLALDLRGDSGDAIGALYRKHGFLRSDLARLRSWRATTRSNAAADLGLVRISDALPALLETLNDRDVRVRQAVVWALGQVGGPDTLAVLVRLLGDPSRLVARRAQEVLAERGNETKDAILSYVGKTASRAGRLAAIELLGWLRMAEGADLLLTFTTDMDPEVRVKSLKAAAAIGDPRFMEIFQRGLEDSRWEVRCQAAKGLSLFGSPDSVPGLTAALRDRHWWVRFYAATALAEVGPLGEEALHEALGDPEPSVQAMARYLLERGGAVPVLP
ncbi:MAG: HEAT repeat domain-containing protein [Gemmatimonadales bacterium]